jgi:hypothetical protein
LIHVTDLKSYWKTKLRIAAEEGYRESGKQKGENDQYFIPVTDLKSYWKIKLRVAAEEWYRESGKQEGSTMSTTKTTENPGSRDPSFEENRRLNK